MLIQCNNCKTIQKEKNIIFNTETEIETCFICKKSGYLMDLPKIEMACQICHSKFEKTYMDKSYQYRCPVCKSYNVVINE
jgi:ribosomal protein S8